jgi:hypothetical protein
MRRLAFISVLLSACASSQPAATAPVVPVVRSVPTDVLELVVGEPSAWVDARIDQLRASPVYARLRPVLERATCVPAADLDWLTQKATRAVVASRTLPDTGAMQSLVVLSGDFSQADADRLLTAAVQRSGQPAGPASPPQIVGRFTLTEQAGLAASLLESHLIVLGTTDWVRAALDSVEHPVASLAGSPLRRDLAGAARCAERSVCMFAAKGSPITQNLQRGLSSAGARSLGRQLSAADAALSLSLPDGLDITFLSRLPSADIAEASVRQAKDLLWQAGLLIRLAGLPDVLNAARVQANANLLQAELSVSAADLAQYEDRLSGLIASDNACPTASEAPVQ